MAVLNAAARVRAGACGGRPASAGARRARVRATAEQSARAAAGAFAAVPHNVGDGLAARLAACELGDAERCLRGVARDADAVVAVGTRGSVRGRRLSDTDVARAKEYSSRARMRLRQHQRERGESLIRAVRDRVDTDVARAKEYSSRAHMRLRQHERERGESLIRAVKDRLGLPGGGTLG